MTLSHVVIPTQCKCKYICTLSFTTWSHGWAEYVGGHYKIKLHQKTKVHLLVLNKFYIQDTSLKEPCCHQQYIQSFFYIHGSVHRHFTYIYIYIYIYIYMCVCVCVCVYVYTGCNRRNGPDFGRVFLRSYYTDITQNTYIQSSMFTEIMAREI